MSRKAKFTAPGQFGDPGGRLEHRNADGRLPVKNMTDWGCTGSKIKEPRYAERAFELCSPVGMEEYSKIVGQVQNVRTPGMLAKGRLYKDSFLTQDRIASTPGQDRAPLKGAQEERSRPFFNGRKKQR